MSHHPFSWQQNRWLPKPCCALAVVQLGPLIFSAGGTAKLPAQMCLLWPRQMSQQVLAEPDLPAFGRGCRRRKARQEPVAVWGCCTPGPSVMAEVWSRPLLFMVLLSAVPSRLPERPHKRGSSTSPLPLQVPGMGAREAWGWHPAKAPGIAPTPRTQTLEASTSRQALTPGGNCKWWCWKSSILARRAGGIPKINRPFGVPAAEPGPCCVAGIDGASPRTTTSFPQTTEKPQHSSAPGGRWRRQVCAWCVFPSFCFFSYCRPRWQPQHLPREPCQLVNCF